MNIECNQRVKGFIVDKERVTGLVTDGGRRDVDSLVLANGSECAALAGMLGVRLAVVPLKGYSITAQITEHNAAPNISFTDAANKLVYARLGNRLRVAGVAEIGAHSRYVDPRRVAHLIERTRQAFGAAVDLETVEPWAGLRPATPNSVPLIRKSPRLKNLYFNVGHGALGLTLAFGSARRLAQMVAQAEHTRSHGT